MANKGRYSQAHVVPLNGVVLSFPQLDKPAAPKSHPDATPKYNASFILDPKQHAAEIKACEAAVEASLKELFPNVKGNRPPKMKPVICFGEASIDTGIGCDKQGELYAGYEGGKFVVNAKNKKRPTLAHRDKTIMTPEEAAEKLYGGCIVNASVEFYAADDVNGQGVYCVLRGVRFLRDGEAFGGGRTAALDELGGDDEEDFG